MAQIPLTVTSVTRNVTDGVNLAAALPNSAAGASDTNTFPNDGNTLLRVKNGSAGAITVTVRFATGSVDGTAITPLGKTYSIPATTGDRLLGPFPVVTYGSTVDVGFSANTTVTVAAIQPAS